ncbi:MAG: hypothetical protein ACUVWJ_03860 [Spirochaetota bacterium]
MLTKKFFAFIKFSIWIFFFIAFFIPSVPGDVLYLKDGRVYLGNPVSADATGITFNVFGEMITIDQSEILRTENDHSALREKPLEVALKDGSVIKGKIVDYDEEIGFLVDINFGALTIPAESIKVIEDPVQRNFYNGFPVHLGITGGYHNTMGEPGSDFGGSLNLSLFAEFNTGLIRGLFAGIESSYFIMNHKTDPDLKYNVITLLPYAMYRVLAFQSYKSFLKSFVPFVALDGGVALVAVRDKRTTAIREKYGEINLAFSPSMGFDYFITEKILLRLKGGWMFVPQNTSFFNIISVNMGAAYCF